MHFFAKQKKQFHPAQTLFSRAGKEGTAKFQIFKFQFVYLSENNMFTQIFTKKIHNIWQKAKINNEVFKLDPNLKIFQLKALPD